MIEIRRDAVAFAILLTLAGAPAWVQAAGDGASAPRHLGGHARTSGVAVRDLFAPAGPTAFSVDRPADRSERGRSLLADVAGDFGRFFGSADTYRLIGLGLAGALATRPLDHPIAKSRFNRELHEGGFVDDLFEPGKLLGGAALEIGGALATYGAGRASGRDGLASLGRDLVRAQLLTQGITQVIKYSVRRWRPDGSARSSFPSGHASGAFATATVIQRHYGWKAGAPAYGLASYIAASRLSENKHFLSDVVLGMAVGITAGRTVTFDRGSRRVELMPVIVPGGAAARASIVTRPAR